MRFRNLQTVTYRIVQAVSIVGEPAFMTVITPMKPAVHTPMS